LGRLGVAETDWEAIRARILAASAAGGSPTDLDVGAVLLVGEGDDTDPAWLFDAGLALGALGGRAIGVQLGDGPPPDALRDLAVVRLDPGREATAQALAARLRALG